MPENGYCPAVNRHFLSRSSGQRCELAAGICGVQKFLNVAIFWKSNRLARKSIIAMCGNSHSSTNTLMEFKKCVFLKDEVSNWLHIRVAATSLDVKANKAIKKNFVLANWSVFPKNGPICNYVAHAFETSHLFGVCSSNFL